MGKTETETKEIMNCQLNVASCQHLRELGGVGGLVKETMHVSQPIIRHNFKKYAATDRVQQNRSFIYATLILVAIALSALGCVISNPANWIAWIVMVVFAWLAFGPANKSLV